VEKSNPKTARTTHGARVSPDYYKIKIKIVVLHGVSEIHDSTTLYTQKNNKTVYVNVGSRMHSFLGYGPF